jgi:hypothetical protein
MCKKLALIPLINSRSVGAAGRWFNSSGEAGKAISPPVQSNWADRSLIQSAVTSLIAISNDTKAQICVLVFFVVSFF